MILSIETSTEVCSIAFHKNGDLLFEDTSYEAYSHAERLAPMIRDAMAYQGIEKADLSAIAISAGPGSYTGLRIGTSTAKGLCYALDIPLITVNTLESMLLSLPAGYENHWKCPMIDARRMEVYCLLANEQNELINGVEAKIIDKNAFEQELINQKIVFYGNGAGKCQPVMMSDNADFILNITPHARDIGALATKKFNKQEFADLAYFEPEYLKPYIAIKAKNPLQ